MDMSGCEGIFGVSIDVTHTPVASWSAHVRATSSAFCTEVPPSAGGFSD
jgi:hypothetical protein